MQERQINSLRSAHHNSLGGPDEVLGKRTVSMRLQQQQLAEQQNLSRSREERLNQR